MRRLTVLLVALALPVSLLGPPARAAEARAAGHGQVPTPGESWPALQEALDAAVEAGFPGIVATVREGRRTYRLASGVADVTTGRPLEPEARVRIGSATKTFTAVLALQLVDRGRLGLDDRLGDWLPDLLPYANEVTVRQLLNHTSGVPDYVGAPGFQEEVYAPLAASAPGEPPRFLSLEPEELVSYIVDGELSFPPGSAFAYSNSNYTLLELLVEKAGRAPYGRQLERRITGPLRLRHTFYPQGETTLRDAQASRGYRAGPDGLVDVTEFDPSLTGASGGIVSTAPDLTRFLRALMSGRLLPRRLLAEMTTTVETGYPDWPIGFQRYGLGLTDSDTPCGPMLGHGGSIFGYLTFAYTTPGGDRQAAITVTMRPPPSPDAVAAVSEALATALCAPLPAAAR